MARDRDIAGWMRRVDEQLRKLGTAARANLTDVRGGFTQWMLSDGATSPRVHIGAAVGGVDVGLFVDDDDGVQRISLSSAGTEKAQFGIVNPDATAQAVLHSGGKLHTPLISCAWQKDPGFTDYSDSGYARTADSSYERMWTCLLPITAGRIVSSIRVAFAVGGVTADVRLQAINYQTAGTPVVLAEESMSSSGWLAGSPWTIPDTFNSPAASPIGHLAMIEIHARVTAGGGEVFVAPDLPVANWV